MSLRAVPLAHALLVASLGAAGAPPALLSQTPLAPPADRLAPAEHWRTLSRADSIYASGDRAGAVALYERVVASDPRNGEALWRLARGRFESGDAPGAIRDAERAFEMGFGDEAGAAFQIARALAGAGRGEEALAWIERSLAAGMEDRPEYRLDDAFEGLRDDPRFRRLAGIPPDGEADREARWAHDLDFYLEEVRRLHAGEAGGSGWFADSVAALKGRVGALTDVEVFAQLFRVTALLGDGHSVAYPMPTEAVPLPPLLPAVFHFFSDGVHVVDAPDEGLVGARVVAIEGHPVEEVLAALPAWIPRDNPMGVLWTGPLALRYSIFLHAMGFAGDPASVTFTVVGRDGARRDVALEPGGGPHYSGHLVPPPGDPPGWLARMDENYWLEPRPDLDAVYVQFNQVREAGDESIEAFARRAADALAGRRNLILDVRHNNGGNNFLIWPLVRLVMWHEMEDPANRTWVITGRNTFSAAQNFVNFLDRETDAVFVGEPSSSKPNFTGEDTFVMLPYSRLRVSISSRYWQDSWPGDGRIWIPVDVPVELSSEEWLSGRDPAMEALAAILSP